MDWVVWRSRVWVLVRNRIINKGMLIRRLGRLVMDIGLEESMRWERLVVVSKDMVVDRRDVMVVIVKVGMNVWVKRSVFGNWWVFVWINRSSIRI